MPTPHIDVKITLRPILTMESQMAFVTKQHEIRQQPKLLLVGFFPKSL